MTRETKIAAQRWAAILLTAILIPLLSWGATTYNASLMKSQRFVQDSAVIMGRDSIWKATVIERLDGLKAGQEDIALRLRQIQCGRRVVDGCR